MIGSIIAGVAALAGAGLNAWQGAKSAAANRAALAESKRENRMWYDRRYNEVGHERADARRALEQMREAQRERMQNVQGRASVMGGSDAVRSAESAAANKSIGDTMGKIDAQQEARKDAIEKSYRAGASHLAELGMSMENQYRANLANAASQASAAAAGISAGLDSDGYVKGSKGSGQPGSVEKVGDGSSSSDGVGSANKAKSKPSSTGSVVGSEPGGLQQTFAGLRYNPKTDRWEGGSEYRNPYSLS